MALHELAIDKLLYAEVHRPEIRTLVNSTTTFITVLPSWFFRVVYLGVHWDGLLMGTCFARYHPLNGI